MSSHTFDDPYADPYADVPWGLDELAPPDDDDAPPPPEFDGYAGALSRSTRDAVPGHAAGPSAVRATGAGQGHAAGDGPARPAASTPAAPRPRLGRDRTGDDPRAVLKDVFGYDDFRGDQAAIVAQVVSGGDAVVLMPTGGGK